MRGNEAALLLLLTLLPIKSPTWFQSFSEFMDEKHANQAIWQEIKTEVQRMEAAGDMETNTGRMADVRIEHMRVCEGASCELKDAPSSCYAEIGESSFQRAPSVTSNNRIFEIICELRQEIEGVLKSLLTKEGSTITWLPPPVDPSHFSAYDDWLARIKKLSKKVNFREVQICITNLRAYKHALMIQRYCSDRSCVQFLAEELQGLFRGPVSSKSCKTHLCTIYNDRCKELECAVVPRNSQLFEALKEKILQTNSDHPSHKIIVYCNSAIVGTVLKTLLEADPLISRLDPTTDKSCFRHLLVTNEKDRPSHDVIICVEDL
ncbi:hypothetical protein CAPTEDRAFT_208575 [Capitella teleta]|uniref:Uncharacterized protein n=1 Tax=Capitella teleta TaxID=283909 RepID=R7U7Y4_CAPTE|nr:hypothetical protein CAPTEDRAFT_208575 [Capitella teleta]|eukprot:ELU02455.1 hypothetical protein CAPTEDRAFT_208575 [Capitella teleta]